MKNLWKYSELDLPFPYGCDTTYLHGARWLKGMGVEDWGCGACYARNFLNETSYFGIDGSPSPWTNLVEDLVSYRSETPGIFMRHVLEHNWKWSKILDNAISSFQRRMVLIIFTPFGQMTAPMPGTDGSIRGFGLVLDELHD
jgi:hypothetical protein